MNKVFVVLTLVVCLVGCLPGGAGSVLPADGNYRELTLRNGGGFVPREELYAYVPATRELTRTWRDSSPEAPLQAKVQLTREQALELDAILGDIRLDTTPRPTSCPTDGPALGLDYVDASGQSWSYRADRQYHCEDGVPARPFVGEKEFRAAFELCQRFLP